LTVNLTAKMVLAETIALHDNDLQAPLMIEWE